MPRAIEKKLIDEFNGKESFSREELLDFYRGFEPDIKEGTLGWRIYNLKSKNIIKVLKRGVYTISYKPFFKPQLSTESLRLAKSIQEKFSDVKYCIWETDWVNEFSQHQSNKHIVIVEVEKDFVESTYYHVKDSFNFDTYINPDKKDVDFYIAESNFPVVIKKLVTRSPVGKIISKKAKVPVPLLEKILVDLFADNKLFYFYQGAELTRIYENTLKNYTINFTKLFSYAKRRDCEEDIKIFIEKNMSYMVKNLLDD
ncbi:DUF6577 family protein [Perlabentimonas gracilis]|jgi:hypothetical protein|uniref:DUF6577 family protein n=1 Tax=Perlabentimonas gracilis TaxID=2715279 RepID=UPI0014078E03|nr:DUF6577 family protein [Perlabentimonas gracilis]NHB69348.1 hypothetical protein [Perlabentimonas gracilis]